jgi:hypothetical protein
VTLIVLVFGLSGLNWSCTSGSAAGEGAARGAATGAAAGAVGGLVSALVFGGDPVERAARGAVWGGSTGAVAGAVSGAQVDRQRQQQVQQELDDSLDALRQDIGDDAFDGLGDLADCRHAKVHKHAEKAMTAENPNHALAGLWLQVLTHADERNEAAARELFPNVVEKDWDIENEAEAEAAMRQGLNDLGDIREAYGLPRVCS